MKKNHSLALCLTAFSTLLLIIFSCSKKTEPEKKIIEKNPDALVVNNVSVASRVSTLDTCHSCGNFFNGSHSGTGNYTYPDIPLDLSCAVSSTTITVGCVYHDVPNRFTVFDKNGQPVASTDWIGWAHCTGPWGSSITTPNVETYITFTYNSSLAPYKLRVETVVTGCSDCSTDPGCTYQSDDWQAHVMCISYSTVYGGTPCYDCNSFFNGSHSGTGFYAYPDITLNLQCQVQGYPVTVGCTYHDVPNRFTIYDKNGNVAATSGWIGWAHCPGPWGFSITTPNVETFINFTYNSSLAPYKLRVETVVTGCSNCSTDPGCTYQSDDWQAHVLCVTPTP